MMNNNKCVFIACTLIVLIFTAGCQTTKRNGGQIQNYSVDANEAKWIRDGDPIQFEDQLWYPADGVESFLDSEMLLMGRYQEVEFFVDKVDVRPFERLYTKFDNNKFRFYEQRLSE